MKFKKQSKKDHKHLQKHMKCKKQAKIVSQTSAKAYDI